MDGEVSLAFLVQADTRPSRLSVRFARVLRGALQLTAAMATPVPDTGNEKPAVTTHASRLAHRWVCICAGI